MPASFPSLRKRLRPDREEACMLRSKRLATVLPPECVISYCSDIETAMRPDWTLWRNFLMEGMQDVMMEVARTTWFQIAGATAFQGRSFGGEP